MLTIHTGRLCPRPPIHRHADEMVDVLDADNVRQRKRAGDLRTGEVLYSFGVVARIERVAEAA